MGGLTSLVRRVAFILVVCAPYFVTLGPSVVHAEEGDSSGGVGTEIDLTNPPEHLKKSTLLEFLRKRQLSKFPGSVEELIRQFTFADASPIRAFIPRGRSAQANNTDEFEPRTIVTSHSANKVATRYPISFEDYSAFPGSDYEGRLYFGFAKRTQQGESLSWNRATQKFDYFVITGVGPQNNPKVFEVVNRENCTKCHQNEAPIFSLPPWSETITHDPTEPKRPPLLAAFTSDPMLYKKEGVVITSVTTPVANNTGLASDSASGAGNRLIQASRILKNACGNNLECRKFILIAAMANPTQSSYLRKNFVQTATTGNDATDLDFVQGPLNRLQALITANTIPNYLNGFMELLTPHWPGDNFAFIAQLLPDMSTVVSGVTPPLQADPLTPRGPLLALPVNLSVAYFYDVAFEALGFNLADSLKFQSLTLAQRMRALGARSYGFPENLRPLLVNWPPSREDLLKYFKLPDTAAATTVAGQDHDDATPLPSVATATASPGGAGAADATVALGHFAKYCNSCHSNPNGENPFIPFTNPTALKTFNQDNRTTVERRLSRSTMPPQNAQQPTAAERQAMLAFFSANPSQPPATQPVGPITTSYLGVRVQDTKGIKLSYVGGTANTQIVAEGFSIDCGKTMQATNQDNPAALQMASTGDKKLLLSLENFPHYFIGNLIEVTPYQRDAEQCYPLGVTRNGALVRLGYNSFRSSFGTVPLTRDANSPNVAILHVGTKGSTAMAVGRDGNIYKLTYPYTTRDSYSLAKTSVLGILNAKWQRVGYKTGKNGTRIVGETMEGRRVAFDASEDEDGLVTLKWDPRETAVNSSDFVPNLLDRDSVVLNPIGSTER